MSHCLDMATLGKRLHLFFFSIHSLQYVNTQIAFHPVNIFFFVSFAFESVWHLYQYVLKVDFSSLSTVHPSAKTIQEVNLQNGFCSTIGL